MFQTVELGQKVSKSEYKAQVPELRTRLLELQRRLNEADFSVVIAIAGVEGAGKSETVNVLHEWFDPRFLLTHAFERRTKFDKRFPPFHRFWERLPPRGRIGIFFGSWYAEPIVARAHGEIGDDELSAAMSRVNRFERALSDDGTLVLKFWFHLSKKEQKKRLKRLAEDPEQYWRVSDRDRAYFKLYDEFRTVSERALGLTGAGHAPWNSLKARTSGFVI